MFFQKRSESWFFKGRGISSEFVFTKKPKQIQSIPIPILKTLSRWCQHLTTFSWFYFEHLVQNNIMFKINHTQNLLNMLKRENQFSRNTFIAKIEGKSA